MRKPLPLRTKTVRPLDASALAAAHGGLRVAADAPPAPRPDRRRVEPWPGCDVC